MARSKRSGTSGTPKRKKQKTKHALRTKSASAPAPSTASRQEPAPEVKARGPLTKEALEALNKFVMAHPSTEAMDERESGVKTKLRYAPEYFTSCGFIEQCEMQHIAHHGGFDMSGLRIALHDQTHDYAYIEHPVGEAGQAIEPFEDDEDDVAVYGDEKDGEENDIDDIHVEGGVDIDVNLAGNHAAQLAANEIWHEPRDMVLDTTADGTLELRRSAARPPSPGPSDEEEDPTAGLPTYFSDPSNLDLNDKAQVRIAIEETAIIMKALFDRLQVLENENKNENENEN
ncbi:hypothetical protein MGYG_07120 [Nannizzia gypsea CBS 118893]|uniref:Uncharacterized protein n=1 Tax=Arthroderma gypseum (strain ATCC MYA-4604 / CBS 118893) TaxID=535722 RepID=E4V248_ARTGP|nr:hypothetical protein MGYG_07120 [Nannizzia gypsea CBS 118893]EFR04113.1 hypothetical protein MGYG_07120 [Nannizzia gypsea CBS 118893]